MKEIWKDIKNMSGIYQVSNIGRVKSLGNNKNKYEKILKPGIRNSYYSVVLSKNKVRKNYRVHRLVAEAFIPNPRNLPQVNHKDENKFNNCVENLEWCDNTYNSQYPNNLAVYCLDLDTVFRSATEASKITKVNRTSILKCCKNKLNSAGGKLWCYEKDKNKFVS